MNPEFAIDRSRGNAVLRHLQANDTAFKPALSTRVDLADYAGKLVDHALRLEAWAGDDLVGLVAVYCNDPDRGLAFVSNVSVLADHAGQGIARKLMQTAITHVRVLGFSMLCLEVDSQALAAVRLYAALGFQPTGATESRAMRMTLLLNPDAPPQTAQERPSGG